MDHKAKGLFFVSLMSIVWAILIIVSKLLLNKGVPVFTYLFQMVTLAAFFIFAYVVVFHRAKLCIPERSLLKYVILIALIGTAGANIVGYYGLEHSSSINYGFLVKTTVVFTVLFAHFFVGEKFNMHKAMLVLLLLLGVYLITTQGREIIPNKYDLLIVLSAFGYAFVNNISKIALRNMEPEVLSLYRLSLGALFLFLFVIFFQEGFYHVRYPFYIVVGALHMAALMLLIYKTLRITSVCYLSMMSMATPIVVTVIGIIFLNEHFSLVQAVGGFLIILSGAFIHSKNI
ncbi:MAG: DMT family transporter [Candidatus Methanofastidiosa archaeon]|nr:DMT family transporter [Candidatus Methanofastidiosa archaeon]